MKKITLMLIAVFTFAFAWQSTSQTLNQNASWPNAGWSITGSDAGEVDTAIFEANPTVDATFAFDDDDAGSGTDNDIAAESPVIDLTAAHGAGETWLEISGDYVYNYLANDELKFQYWDADGAAWVDWGFAFTADTASAPTDNYCSGTAESYTSSVLDIAAFTATQLSGFRYRISYNDDPAGADWNYGFCFQSPTITSATPPTCQDPSGMTASNVTDTSADLSWTAGGSGETNWNLEWKAGADFAPGTGAEDASDTATGTPAYSATGLTAETTYYIYYQADCGASGGSGVSNWVGPFVGTTACATFTAPYTQDFENAGTIPNCWEQGSTNSENWIFSTSGGHVGDAGTITGSTASGGYFAYVDDSTPDNTGTTLLSPFVDVSGLTTPALLFYEISNNEGNSNVTLTVDVWDGAAWNNVGTYNTNTAGWEQKIIDLSGLTITGPVQARFVVDELVASDFYDDVAIDDVTFDELPACPVPSGLVATPTSLTEATIDWNAGSTETAWNYEYDVTGFTQGSGNTGTVNTTPTLGLTGLTAGETYDIYIQADCGGDTSSFVMITWTQPNVGESCATPIVATVEADCSTATPHTIDYSTAADLGPAASCDTTTNNTGAWFEFVAPASGSVKVTFTDTNEYAVFDACGGTELVCVSTATNQADLTGLTPSATYYMAVWKDSATTGTTDVCFEEVTCAAPSALTATSITDNSASLGWTQGGSETLWDVEIVDITGGGSATGTPTATGVTNPYMAMSLTAANDYEFYVRADCGGAGVSDWAGPFAFTTACVTFTPAYTADFTTVAPTCWSEGNDTDVATGPNGTNGGWANDDYLNVVGVEAAKFNLYNTGDQDWLVSPTFDFSAGGYGLAFDVGVTAWNSTDAETPNLMGSDDEVQILVSEDDGATWTMLEAFNVGNAPSHLGESRLYDLSSTTSSTVKFAFWATEGTVDDAEDIDFFVANFTVDAYTTLGTDEVEFAGFKYFPNPVQGALSVRAQNNIDHVAVYNMLGQEVINVAPNRMSDELDMSALNSGTYFVRVSINGAVESFKVIKE